jgi:hypothetical protein
VCGELVKALTKNSYWFLNFSDRPFKSCDFLNFKFCLIKRNLNWTDFAPRRIPIWNPVRSFLYIDCSLPDSWFPGCQLSDNWLESWVPMGGSRQLASRILMDSCAPMTGLYWFPVRSNSIRNLPCSAVDPPIGAQDSNPLSENWRPGNQESGNEQSIYKKLLTAFQIGFLQGARLV